MPSVDHAGASLYYEASGSGPAVVFAHGAGGNRISWWQQLPHFAERHTVVAFDHRCFGRSRCAPDDFHPRHFAGDLAAVLDACGIERAALVCQSMGGWTGLRTALEHPERVRCLVLAGTPAGILTPGVKAAAGRVAKNVEGEGIRGNAALAPDFPRRRPDLAHLYDQISALNTGFDPAHLSRLVDEDARVDAAQLTDYTTPTLVVSGGRDQLFPPEALREVAEQIPGARFVAFPEAGHSVYFEDAPAFNQTLEEFLAQHPA